MFLGGSGFGLAEKAVNGVVQSPSSASGVCPSLTVTVISAVLPALSETTIFCSPAFGKAQMHRFVKLDALAVNRHAVDILFVNRHGFCLAVGFALLYSPITGLCCRR